MSSRGQKKFNRRLAQGLSDEGLLELHPTIAKRFFTKQKLKQLSIDKAVAILAELKETEI